MKHLITALSLIFFCAPTSARWYAGAGLHGLNFDQEQDGDLETNFLFQGPRGYAGWRINDNFRVEGEIGWSSFKGKLFSDNLDADLQMWNVAMTGLYFLPVKFPIQPFFYAGAGRSYWNYDITLVQRFGSFDFTDSSSDLYWHLGIGGEIVVNKNMCIRVGYRHWQVEMHPDPEQWAITPDRYSYQRGGLDIAVHWLF